MIALREADTARGFKAGYRFGFAGPLSPKTENKIAFLRTVTALRFLNGKAVTKKALLKCINIANSEVHQKFSQGMREVKAFTARLDRSELEYPACHPTCDDPRLSFNAPGKVYLGVNFSDKEINEMPEAQVVELLDIVGAGLNMEEHQPEGKALSWLKQEIMDSPGFKRTRVLMAQLCT